MYAIFGGTPYYLEQIDERTTLEENILLSLCESSAGNDG